MKIQVSTLAIALALTACAKRPDAIVPADIPMQAYTAYDCNSLAIELAKEKHNRIDGTATFHFRNQSYKLPGTYKSHGDARKAAEDTCRAMAGGGEAHLAQRGEVVTRQEHGSAIH